MKRKLSDEYKEEIKTKTNNEYLVTGQYINRDTEITYIHNIPTCNTEFPLTSKKFYKNKYPCKKCRGALKHKNNIKEDSAFKKELTDLYGDDYTPLEPYNGNKQPILFRHNSKVCDYNVFPCTPNNILRGHICPACNKGGTSFQELCILYTIQTIFPNAKKQKFYGRECDIVIKIDNKNIGIQYDGVYYHIDEIKDNSFNRMFLSLKNSSFLIRVREKGCPDLDVTKGLHIISSDSWGIMFSYRPS